MHYSVKKGIENGSDKRNPAWERAAWQASVSARPAGVAAQVINVLYNIVDRIYIGNIPGIGDMALTGVGVTLPVIMVIAAFSAFVGMGGAPLASIRLGRAGS